MENTPVSDDAPIDFTALDDFWSDETKSQYCADMSYRVTSDMAKLVAGWVKEGLARYGRVEAQVMGTGAVQDEKE